jgi:arginine N-succinyltransferase
MLVIRPVTMNDLDGLLELAQLAGFGLTTLPRDREFLHRRIAKSLRSFRDMGGPPAGECYLFVLEDLASGRIAGTSGIVSKVGGFEPFYVYRIEKTIHESQSLGVRKEIPLLHLVSEHNGPCEIGSLFLAPDCRRDGNGRLLSLSRFLFMADWPQSFDPLVLAEMRGVIDEQGRSVFWEALGKHFFEIDLHKADYLSLINKRFIADLMPKHPIYIPLLPPEAQAVVGQVHEQTRGALRILEDEGFRFESMVDIFEGGPVVTCPLAGIRTVRDSRMLRIVELADEPPESQPMLVSNARESFRACRCTLRFADSDGAIITRECADALQVGVGDWLRFAPLSAGGGKERVP